VPRPERLDNPLVRKFLRGSPKNHSAARGLGEFKPVEPAARRNGKPVLGEHQVYVIKYGTEYHRAWCRAVADAWDLAPRSLHVTLLADVGERSACTECAVLMRKMSSAQEDELQPHPSPRLPPSDALIPLKVIGVAHGILFLAAGQEHQELLNETAVEPATPLSVDGRRDGMVVRLDATRTEPLLVVQLDPRATVREGPYQMHLRRPLQRSATKPYAVESVEPAPLL
jgi:hypothetical protein